VTIDPARRVTGLIEADNAGNRYTGEVRAGGTIHFNNPAGRGDLLSLRVLASDGGLAYGRAAYQTPAGGGSLGLAYTHLRYELGREFEDLDADGRADILGVFGSYPLIRSRDLNLKALAGADVKQLEDRIGLVSAVSEKQVRIGSLGFGLDSRDRLGGGGWNDVSAGVAVGDLDIQSAAERAADALGAQSDGGFTKVYASLARLQSLGGPLSLFASVRGQVASDNLDISEKMELGGAYGVRAYPEGEAFGDQGYLATLEGRLLLNRWTRALPGEFQLIGFVDVGEVDFDVDAFAAGSSGAQRSGAGAGLSWSRPNDLLLTASYARKLGDAEATSGPTRTAAPGSTSPKPSDEPARPQQPPPLQQKDATMTRSNRAKPSFHSALSASTALVRLASLAVVGLAAASAAQAQTLPTGGSISAGSATIASGPGALTITQTSQNAALNWGSFSIGAADRVTFIQPSSNAIALNRVLGSDASSILGNLSANGKVFLINPNGILFGQGATVNVGGWRPRRWTSATPTSWPAATPSPERAARW
jgi:filamentous hemagglutinin family protein